MTPPQPQLVRWTQAVRLDPDVDAGNTRVAAYAIDLGALVADDPNIPRVYREADAFFRVTHMTSGLRRMLEDVLNGLAGGSVDRVLQLRSPFGGGKSHTLASLYHAAKHRRALEGISEAAALPDPGPVRVAVFDGQKFDVRPSIVNGSEVRTLWGNLAAGLDCYETVAYHDLNRVAPAGGVIAAMLGEGPTLLLIDELLKYVERALAEPTGESNLGRQTLEFVQSLSTEVARAPRAVMVYSLQASDREAFGNTALLSQLDHLTSRVDAKREPVVGDEILPVLKCRLLDGDPESAAVQTTADAMAEAVTNARTANAPDDVTRRLARDDGVALRRRFAAAYPFHPALIDIMRERWASLPDFQRTRGALRFLAVSMHAVKEGGAASYLLGPGDIPLADADVTQALFTEVGQREPFKAVLERDFLGQNARIGRIDAALVGERPELAGVNTARRIATAILCYSFGGLMRPGDEGGEPMATGVTEEELLRAVVNPDLDSITAQNALYRLREQCLYLHFDGVHYVFKTTPNITQTLEDQAGHITRQEVKDAVEADLRSQLAGSTGAIIWPEQSQAIPDGEPRFLLAYLPLDFATVPATTQDQQARQLFSKYGDVDRRYRNGVGLAVPDATQVAALRQAKKYLKAIEVIRGQRQQLNLTQGQLLQLRRREDTEKVAYETAMRKLYEAVWLPKVVGGQIEVEKVSIGGRALAAIPLHGRLVELLTSAVQPPRVFTSVTPDKLMDLMCMGDGEGQARSYDVKRIIDTFYGTPGFPRLDKEDAIRKAIALGVREGKFGYVRASNMLSPYAVSETGGYLARRTGVSIGVEISEGSIDADSGFVVVPSAIESEAPPAPVVQTTSPIPTSGVSYQVTPATTGAEVIAPTPTPQRNTSVRLAMRVSRRQVYTLANTLNNLTDKAESVQIVVEATKADGFDPGWLRNAVLEPLEEADIDVQA